MQDLRFVIEGDVGTGLQDFRYEPCGTGRPVVTGCAIALDEGSNRAKVIGMMIERIVSCL